MRIVQIANDYLNTALYARLFNALEKNGVDNVVFVPVQNGVSTEERGIVL